MTFVTFTNVVSTPFLLQSKSGHIFVCWSIAAIGEEIIFRGYLINRLIDLLGESLAAKILILICAGTTFGFVHYYQGIHGIISAGLI
jgi:membrane protease YdiL (CAAX protease family)